MTFGLKTGPSTGWGLPTVGVEESAKILNRFAEAGGSFIDTYVYASASHFREIGC